MLRAAQGANQAVCGRGELTQIKCYRGGESDGASDMGASHLIATCRRLSLAPGFSRVGELTSAAQPLQRFFGACKPLKRLTAFGRPITRLKPGANEMNPAKGNWDALSGQFRAQIGASMFSVGRIVSGECNWASRSLEQGEPRTRQQPPEPRHEYAQGQHEGYS
jgi:hypothetical protein